MLRPGSCHDLILTLSLREFPCILQILSFSLWETLSPCPQRPWTRFWLDHKEVSGLPVLGSFLPLRIHGGPLSSQGMFSQQALEASHTSIIGLLNHLESSDVRLYETLKTNCQCVDELWVLGRLYSRIACAVVFSNVGCGEVEKRPEFKSLEPKLGSSH